MDEEATIREAMAALARRRWSKATAAQRQAQGKMLAAARLKRKHRQAKVRARG